MGEQCVAQCRFLLWTRKSEVSETKTIYQYVVDLQERLEQTCQLAKKELIKSRVRYETYYNRQPMYFGDLFQETTLLVERSSLDPLDIPRRKQPPKRYSEPAESYNPLLPRHSG